MKHKQTTLLLVDLKARLARRYQRGRDGKPDHINDATLGDPAERLLPLGSKLGLALLETFRKNGTLRLASVGGKRGTQALLKR